MMKTTILSLCLCIGFTPLFAQSLTEADLTGSWETVKAHLHPELGVGLDPETKLQMKQMATELVGTVFQFKKEGAFVVDFPATLPPFMQELEFINNTNWRIDKGKSIEIGTEEDDYTLVGIMVIEERGKKLFMLEETPFILEVQKRE